MSNPPGFDSLNSVTHLYLSELSEPKDNSLRIIVDEAVGNRTGADPVQADTPGLAGILKDSFPIESVEGCKRFELLWRTYVAYLVTEECVGSCGESAGETYSGKLFRLYTKSHFLDHLARDTGAHPQPIQHYKLTCLNHLIDVASYGPPEIRQIGSVSLPFRLQ
jgi:hypothetical protein